MSSRPDLVSSLASRALHSVNVSNVYMYFKNSSSIGQRYYNSVDMRASATYFAWLFSDTSKCEKIQPMATDIQA